MPGDSGQEDREQRQAQKLEKLRAALEEFTERQNAGETSGLFDHEAEEKKAEVRRRALLLLDQRARSRSDLMRAKLIDDEAFAREWVRQRAQRRGKSSRALDMELRDKGVDSEIRALALEQIDAVDERETARRVAEKKARSESRIPEDRADYDKALRRIVGALARRGFPAGVSMELSREALEQRIAHLQAD